MFHILLLISLPLCYFLFFHLLDEWKNFLERMGAEQDSSDEIKEEDLRDWASFRGQTLSRTGEQHKSSIFLLKLNKLGDVLPIMNLTSPGSTVRGMMYYRQALKLQAFLDMAEHDGTSHEIKLKFLLIM